MHMNMTPARTQAINQYLDRTDWTPHALRRFVWVPVGAKSYYFYFNEQDEIVRVEVE